MAVFHDIHSPEQKLSDPLLEAMGITLIIKREDLIHPLVSGNKWRKLKYNLLKARTEGLGAILSFGGAYSNHIYALAAAGKMAAIKTIGIIRGEETHPLNPTLRFAVSCGMELHYLDRESYRHKNDAQILETFQSKFPDALIIPEGGSNSDGVKGCMEIIPDIHSGFDVVCSPVGSGGTMAGLIAGLKGTKQVLGFSAIKGTGILDEKVKSLIPGGLSYTNWQINYDYHFGGYAKINRTLIEFVMDFERRFGIKPDPIYTGKMFFGLFDLIRQGYFDRGTRILALHTGGLQGWEGMKEKTDKLLQKKDVL